MPRNGAERVKPIPGSWIIVISIVLVALLIEQAIRYLHKESMRRMSITERRLDIAEKYDCECADDLLNETDGKGVK